MNNRRHGFVISLICCVILLQSCIDIVKKRYATWDDLPDAESNKYGWEPDFFYEEEFIGNFFDAILIYDVASVIAWGKLNYEITPTNFLSKLHSNDVYNGNRSFPSALKGIGLEEPDELIWYYYPDNVLESRSWKVAIDSSEKTVYFYLDREYHD